MLSKARLNRRLHQIAPIKPLRKKNSKRQYQRYEVYLHHQRRKRVEVTNSLITQRLPHSIHAVTTAGFEIKVVLFLIATMITLIIKQNTSNLR